MGQLWIPRAERRQRHSGWNMDGGPSRVTHHITYDSLRGDGSPAISFDGVTNYLLDKGYEPQLVIDPVTGDIIQTMPADRGGSALRAHNKTGDINLQIEWYFTPVVVRGGVEYGQLPDTPMRGLDEVMEMADSWGIPRDAPLSPNDRNSSVWFNRGGHYGHYNVPDNDHSDPVCSIEDILAKVGQVTPQPPKEDQMFSASPSYPCGHLTSVRSRSLLDVQGNVQNAAPVGTYGGDGYLDQRWRVVSQRPLDEVSLVCRDRDFALDSPGDKAVWAWEYDGGQANQRWFIDWQKHGLWTIRHAHRNGLVLTTEDKDAPGRVFLAPPKMVDGEFDRTQLWLFTNTL